MASKEAKNVIEISDKGKTFKDNVINTICALLNSDGGVISLKTTQKDFQLRRYEQTLNEMLTLTEFTKLVKISEKETHDETYSYKITIERSEKLITRNYNLYLPTKTEIKAIKSLESQQNVYDLIQRRVVEDGVDKDDFPKNFVRDSKLKVEESEVNQFKLLENSTDGKNKFVKKVFKNKFTNYVSGFANHRGGHIFYGINDKGTICGQKLRKEDIEELRAAINKELTETMIWTLEQTTPKEGVDWKLFVEKVKDKDKDEDFDPLYVVIIFIKWCKGGVFTAKPECYYMAKNDSKRTVKTMDFRTWWHHFSRRHVSTGRSCIQEKVDVMYPVTWSTVKNRDFFINFSERLVDHRDAGEYEKFDRLCEIGSTKFAEKNGLFPSLAGKITLAYKSGKMDEARGLIKEYESSLDSCKADRQIMEARLGLSESLVHRKNKEFDESYDRGKKAFQQAQLFEPGLCLLWLSLECSMNAALLAFKKHEQDENQFLLYKEEALSYLEQAVNVAYTLREARIPFRHVDFYHKFCIYKAWVLLNVSINGKFAQLPPTETDMSAACDQILAVTRMELNGETLSELRRVEYFLVQSDYSKRKSERLSAVSEGREMKLVRESMAMAVKAKGLAKKSKIKNMEEYAQARIDALKRLSDEHEKVASQSEKLTFEGIEY